jgi:hypothetical protein
MPERADYHHLRTLYPWIVEPDKRIVISSDLDGLMSAVLLSHVLGWEVVGVYTLNDLWVVSDAVGTEPGPRKHPEALLQASGLFFVDLDINRGWARSVGHHILQWSADTPIPDHAAPQGSLNPNLLRGISFKEFDQKYPYGTFHFLLACFSAWGLLEGFRPNDELTTLLLHIDSSFENSINYQDNAIRWLDWLGGSAEESPLYPICHRMLRFNPRTIIEQFKSLADRFRSWGLSPRRQAKFSDPTDKEVWHSQQMLLAWVRQNTGWSLRSQCRPDSEYVHFTMRRESGKPTKTLFSSVMPQRPFSYAIIGSDQQGLNYNWFVD